MEEKIFDENFYRQLGTFRVFMKQKSRMGMSGERKSSAKGSSVEFSDFREYMLGDDIRRIDWNAYGRMDKLFVKLFMEEKEGVFHVLTDCSKSMDFGVKNKSLLARRIGGVFSYMVLHSMDRLYLGALKEKSAQLTNGMTGQQSFQRVLKELEAYQFEGETHLTDAVKKISFHGKGMTVLISDFYEEGGIEELIKYLTYQKQEVLFIQVLASEEINPDAEGTINLIDSETEEQEKVTMSNKVLKEYKQTLFQFQKELERICKKYQASFLQVSTEDTLREIIYKGIQNGHWNLK